MLNACKNLYFFDVIEWRSMQRKKEIKQNNVSEAHL